MVGFFTSCDAFNPGVQPAAKHGTSQQALVPHPQDSLPAASIAASVESREQWHRHDILPW